MRRNVKMILLFAMTWMFVIVYYLQASKGDKVEEKTTFTTPGRNSSPVISPFYCESDTLNHSTTEVVIGTVWGWHRVRPRYLDLVWGQELPQTHVYTTHSDPVLETGITTNTSPRTIYEKRLAPRPSMLSPPPLSKTARCGAVARPARNYGNEQIKARAVNWTVLSMAVFPVPSSQVLNTNS
uniref:Uncharacterized protein n=1 Tax=Timema monikensis TaxID=170555 RepID=A0A7R9HPF8_9NEOP|nr:unnamed protein product [Timema monikensis]